MELGQFVKKLPLWQKRSCNWWYIRNNTINYKIKYLSKHVLQLYIKIHLCRGATNNILRKNHKKLQIMWSIWFARTVFFFFLKPCVKFPRNTIYVLVCLKDRVVPGNSSFCSAYLAFGWIRGPSAISVEMQAPVKTVRSWEMLHA